MKGYELTRRGKITALCLVLMAVLLLVSAFTLLGRPSPSPSALGTGASPDPGSSPAAPTSASAQPEPPTPTPTPSPPAPTPTSSADPTVKPTAKPAPSQLPSTQTTLYFAIGTSDILVPNPPLQDYVLDSYDGLALVVEGFASDREDVASAEQLALERAAVASQLLTDLGAPADEIMNIGTVQSLQDDTEALIYARVDIYFISADMK